MSNPFTKHPKEVGLNYFGHFVFAWSVVGNLFVAFWACMIHSFFPFLFTRTTSKIVAKLNDKIEHRKGNNFEN